MKLIGELIEMKKMEIKQAKMARKLAKPINKILHELEISYNRVQR